MAENLDQFADGVGDVVVVVTIMAAQLGIDFNELEFKDMASTPAEFLVTLGLIAQALAKDKTEAIPELLGQLMCMLNLAVGVYAAHVDNTGAEVPSMTLQHCYDLAYAEIKDRTGKMIDGVFVREE